VSGEDKRTNEEWLEVLRGSEAATDAALADLRTSLYRSARFYLLRHASDPAALQPEQLAAMAEDAAQEATMAVLAKLDTFRGQAAFLTWAAKFGVTTAAAMLRRHWCRDLSLEQLSTDWEGPLNAFIGADSASHPDVIAERREVCQLLLDVAREELTDKQRDVVAWVLFEGVPPDEFAERVGISLGACYKMAHDARRAFRRGIERHGWTCAEVLQAFAAPDSAGVRGH
jgi:RNA polymerase sigma-70 factor (ECF subfamily)